MVLGGEQLSKTTGGPKSLGLPPHTHTPCFPCNNPAGRVRSRWGGAPAGTSSIESRGSKQPQKVHPTPPHLEPTGPEGLSLRAGLLASKQTGAWGSDAPPRGMRPCRHLAGRRLGRRGGEGGQPATGAPHSWLTSPFRAAGPASRPALPSLRPAALLCHQQVARAVPVPAGAGRLQPPGTQLPHVARRRQGHPQPQPAPLTWSRSRRGRGSPRPLAACQPRPTPGCWVAQRTCTRGWRGPGLAGFPPHNVGRMPAGCQGLPPSQSSGREGR